MAKARKEKASKKLRLRVPMLKITRLQVWKTFLIAAVAILAIVTAFYWYQENFRGPMPKEVFDRVAYNPILFSVFTGLGCSSLVVQYYLLPQEKRKREIIKKTPILIFMGVGVAIIALALVRWQNPDAPARTMISTVARRPFILGASGGFMLEGIIIAFLLSSKEEQKRCVRALTMLLAAFLTFVGPTYLLYILQRLAVPGLLLILLGLASFTVGIILFANLLKGERKVGASA